MRLPLALLLAVVVVALPSVMALPVGAKGKDPESGVGDSTLLVEEVINQGDDSQTTEEVIEDAGESGVETLDMPEDDVPCKREVLDPVEVEAEVTRDEEVIQEKNQDLKEGSEPTERHVVVVESDSSEESSNEEETVISSEATEDQDSQDEVPVDVSKKSRGRILENSRAPAKSKNKPTPKVNENSTDSLLEERSTELPSERSLDEENYEILVQAEPSC